MELDYKFNPAEAYEIISKEWKAWADKVGATKWVLGISGGKDSTVVAALTQRIFGADRVIGVLMPNGVQDDIQDSKDICTHLGIRNYIVNIGFAYRNLLNEISVELEWGSLGYEEAPSYDTRCNLPPRLRMATLYAIAQTEKAMVLNTSNLSEMMVGYETLWGDNTGSYAPIQGLTATEVVFLGDWLKLPFHLTHKVPMDGLQEKTDEDKLGFSYGELDVYIREGTCEKRVKALIDEKHRQAKFKLDMVKLEHPKIPGLQNYVMRG